MVTTGTSSVAVIGAGRMGAAMATRIAAAGFEMTLWSRDLAKANDLATKIGARVADTPAGAASAADVVVSSLADDAAVREVYLGADGVTSGLREGTVVLDTSTIDPETSVVVGDAVDAGHADFLDAPVSGSVATVLAGTLMVMVGGDPEHLDRARPVLDTFAARVVCVGGRGSGSAAKLAVNALVHGLNGALSEALVLAERAGVDREIAYEIFASGAGGAPFVHYKRQAFEEPDSTPVAFSLDLVAKDLHLITSLARRVGAPMEQTECALRVVERAVATGMGDRDMSALAVHLRGGE